MSTPRVGEALAKLAVFAADEFSVDEMLSRLGEVATAALGVDGVGVMGTNTGVGDRTRFVYASQTQLEPLEFLQEASQAGPCKQAAVTLQTVECSTPGLMAQWPGFAAAARKAGMRAVVATPLVSRGRCWGVLDLYWATETSLSEADMADVDLLAKVAVSYLVIADDRDQAGIAQQQLAARLLHDPLTGLANRELIHELTYHALVNAHRRGRSVALLFIDLDKFKTVNDTRGHRAGDTVLRTVAQRMRDAVRAGDTVSRLSGDEFLILCEDLPDPGADVDSALSALGERISTEIARPIAVDSGPALAVGASIGIASANGQPSVADLIHDADQAMYRAKQDGRHRVVVHHHVDQTGAGGEHRQAFERELFGALERGELRVHYQPIRDVTAQRVVAVEALLRWEHPGQGLLPASRFIEFAISNGTIVRIGQWMIGQALQAVRGWQDAVPDRAPSTVFVNFAPQQLTDPSLSAVVEEQLQAWHLTPPALGIEMTEKFFDDVRIQPQADHFRAQQHPLAIDDFGTGYSSLARLIEVPVTYLKLDRSLVSRLPDNPRARALLEAVMTIAGALNLGVIGEGVENAAQAEILATAGCTLQQGHHHGYPHPAHQLTGLF